MGKMERKCSWRPLICLGLRALMKPLLPGCRPLPLRLWWRTGQSQRGRQRRACCSEPFSGTEEWQESRELALLSSGKEPVFLRLCSCGLLPCCTHESRQPALGSCGGVSLRACLKENLLVLMGRERAVLGDIRRQNDNFRVTFIWQSWMRQRKHMGTCCGTVQFLSHFNRAIEKPNLGSKNPTQKSCHGSVLHAGFPLISSRLLDDGTRKLFLGE